MLGSLKEALQSLLKKGEPCDPSQFNDPLAQQTEWRPLRGGGSNFRTHKLVKENFNRLEFRPTAFALVFFLVFFLVGLAVMFGFTYLHLSRGTFAFNVESIMPIVLGLIFTTAGILMHRAGSEPRVFDKQKGYYWKGRQGEMGAFDPRKLKVSAELRRIHALQLISEYCRSDKSSYYSYELNLVLEDGNRLNVVDHGNRKKLREDARTLAAFLGVPVWDAI